MFINRGECDAFPSEMIMARWSLFLRTPWTRIVSRTNSDPIQKLGDIPQSASLNRARTCPAASVHTRSHDTIAQGISLPRTALVASTLYIQLWFEIHWPPIAAPDRDVQIDCVSQWTVKCICVLRVIVSLIVGTLRTRGIIIQFMYI